MMFYARLQRWRAVSCIYFACLLSVATFLIPNFKIFYYNTAFEEDQISEQSNIEMFSLLHADLIGSSKSLSPSASISCECERAGGPSELERGKRDQELEPSIFAQLIERTTAAPPSYTQ